MNTLPNDNKNIHIEIINTGSELMLGRVLNTHHQWLALQLDELGYTIDRQLCINDDNLSITGAVRESLSRADLIIVTGGLGPTSDDLTRNDIAQLLGRRLLVDSGTIERIQNMFSRRGTPIPFNCEIQAQYPEGALIIPNDYGTAPGLAIELYPNLFRKNQQKSFIILLPGPPRELYPMFRNSVIPLLRKKFPFASAHKLLNLRTACTGESSIEKIVAPHLQYLVKEGLQIGYCARVGEVDFRLEASGQKADEILKQAEQIAREKLGEIIFGTGTQKLEEVLIQLLTQHHKTLGTAESCTGGFLSHRLTNVPGASAVFMGSCVTYSNDFKRQLLGVQSETLEKWGAVSEQTSIEMASGMRTRMNLDYALSITGIAGPGGGTPEKPVGTVYIGLATPEGTFSQRLYCPYERESFKFYVSQFALDWLRRTIIHSLNP